MRFTRALVGLVSCCLIFTGCATTHPLALPAGAADSPPVVHRGEHLYIGLRNGEYHSVTVVETAPDHIIGSKRGSTATQRFDYADMVSLKVREQREKMSSGKKVGVALLVVVGVAAAAFGVLLYELGRSDPDGE